MAVPHLATETVEPQSLSVKIGNLEVTADAQLEWYPGLEFCKDGDGNTWLSPIAEPKPDAIV